MKRVAIIFLAAVLGPSLLLAVLALRAQRDREWIAERQRALLYQGVVDSLALEVNDYIEARQGEFRDLVDAWLAERPPEAVAEAFNESLRRQWELANVGFVSRVDLGCLVAPGVGTAGMTPEVAEFFSINRDLLVENQPVPVFVANFGGLDPGAVATNAPQPAPPSPDAEPPDGTRIAQVDETRQLVDNKLAFQRFRKGKAQQQSGSPLYSYNEDIQDAERDGADGGGQAPMDGRAMPAAAAESPERPATEVQAELRDPADAVPDEWAFDPQITRAGTAEERQAIEPPTQLLGLEPASPAAADELGRRARGAAPAEPIGAPLEGDAFTNDAAIIAGGVSADQPIQGTVAGQAAALPDPPDAAAHQAIELRQQSAAPAAPADAPAPEAAAARGIAEPLSRHDFGAMPDTREEESLAEATPPAGASANAASSAAQNPARSRRAMPLADEESPAAPSLDAAADPGPRERGSQGRALAESDGDAATDALTAAVDSNPFPLQVLEGLQAQAGAAAADPAWSESSPADAAPTGGQQRRLARDAPEGMITIDPQSGAGARAIAAGTNSFRNTVPMVSDSADVQPSAVVSAFEARRSAFFDLVQESVSGAVSRVVDDRMTLLFWYRPPAFRNFVFGAEVRVDLLKEVLSGVVDVELEVPGEACVALLDEAGAPVARSMEAFATDWSRPFVSREIGRLLPRWEMAAYLVDPGQLSAVARAQRLQLWLLVCGVLAAIAAGGILLFVDARRRLVEARQKTDFVSNVSHEFRTPLTSIRMFADLLRGDSGSDAARRERYAEVIEGEANRLSRLINNVLDFSRLERGDRNFRMEPLDLRRLARDTIEQLAPQLAKAGMSVRLDEPPQPIVVRGDADALSQVLVNLLSNAEKYAAAGGEVTVEVRSAGPAPDRAILRVCDRGPGVPRGVEKRIFERFFRTEDSLTSSIPGTGLGLTLARQMTRAHGGDLRYEPREGGGSCFVAELPLDPDASAPAGFPVRDAGPES